MDLHLKINLDNACFDGNDLGPQLEQLFKGIATRFPDQLRADIKASYAQHRNISDSNGNIIGTIVIKD